MPAAFEALHIYGSLLLGAVARHLFMHAGGRWRRLDQVSQRHAENGGGALQYIQLRFILALQPSRNLSLADFQTLLGVRSCNEPNAFRLLSPVPITTAECTVSRSRTSCRYKRWYCSPNLLGSSPSSSPTSPCWTVSPPCTSSPASPENPPATNFRPAN